MSTKSRQNKGARRRQSSGFWGGRARQRAVGVSPGPKKLAVRAFLPDASQPQLGRFLSRDPRGSLNRYVYTANNPVGRVDPSGLAWTAQDPSYSTQVQSIQSNLQAKLSSPACQAALALLFKNTSCANPKLKNADTVASAFFSGDIIFQFDPKPFYPPWQPYVGLTAAAGLPGNDPLVSVMKIVGPYDSASNSAFMETAFHEILHSLGYPDELMSSNNAVGLASIATVVCGFSGNYTNLGYPDSPKVGNPPDPPNLD
jgi:hypothetical protein